MSPDYNYNLIFLNMPYISNSKYTLFPGLCAKLNIHNSAKSCNNYTFKFHKLLKPATPHNLMKRKIEKNSIKILAVLIVILIVSQGFTIYFIVVKTSQSLNAVKNAEASLNSKIESNKLETQSQINELTNSLNSIALSQTDIQQQVSQIKAATSSDFSGIIEENIKGVVTIQTNIAQGTGFLITNDGYILTNAHVLSGAKYANIYAYNSEKYSASLIGYNSNLDVALLKVSGNFDKLSLGDSDSTKLGEKVIAIGNPLGLSFSTSEGIISARDRTGSNNLPYYFQTDASLNPGNSGGPLINTRGEVIGINNFKISGGESLGFALEINYAKEIANQIALKELNSTIL